MARDYSSRGAPLMPVARWRHPYNALLSWLGMLSPVLAAAIAYMVIRPPSVDLAEQLFRCQLFASDGFLAWNNYWYGGHYLLGYSLLFPPLGAALGATAAGGLAAIAATGLFAILARRHYLARAQWATLWFSSGMVATLLSGRLTFALGVAIGLAALVVLDSERPLLAVPLAAATSFASPVAGFFLLLIGVMLALVNERRRGAILALAAALPIASMALAFPTNGPEPFDLSSLLGTLGLTLFVFIALPPGERLFRRGALLYAAAVLIIYALPNAMGGNVVRLSDLAAAPVLALGLGGPRRRALLVLCAVPLLLAVAGRGARRLPGHHRPRRPAQLLPAVDLDPAPANRGRPGAHRDPADRGSLGGLLHGSEVPPGTRLGAPARIR